MPDMNDALRALNRKGRATRLDATGYREAMAGDPAVVAQVTTTEPAPITGSADGGQLGPPPLGRWQRASMSDALHALYRTRHEGDE